MSSRSGIRKGFLANMLQCGPRDNYSVGLPDVKAVALFNVLLDAHPVKVKLRKDFVP